MLLELVYGLTNRLRDSREKSPEEALPFLPSGIVDRNGNAGTFEFKDNNLISYCILKLIAMAWYLQGCCVQLWQRPELFQDWV
jgi:hypothetical protein